ncbi:MAG: TRAP transporter large permease [Alphaproteobacteria bacterium]|nr:TRAP transporter large permease [Alphaproteobacteria bacterium]
MISTMTEILIVWFVALMLGVPLYATMGLAALAFVFFAGITPQIVPQKIAQAANSFPLLAAPLFILMGNIMNSGGITERIFAFATACVGWLRGGLCHANILASVIFAGMSGSAVADAGGVGTLEIKAMKDEGYDAETAAAITAASATIGPIIPPSILMVLYALASSTSVGGLFMAGVLPGILMAGMMMILVAWIARRRNYPTIERPPAAEIFRIVRRSILPLLMPVVMLGGIYTGVFTPTEAAAVACAYALILAGLIYRMLGLKEIVDALVDSARITATVACVFFGAFVFSYILTVERIPMAIAAFLDGKDISANMFLFAVNILFLLLASVMDEAAMILVVIPLLMPTVQALGIDPIHFGLVVTFNATIGLIAPPYGMVLFVVSGVNKIPVREILAEIWPFIGILLVTLAIVTYVPWLSLALPTYFGFVR